MSKSVSPIISKVPTCALGGLLSYPDVTPQDIKTPLYSRSQLGLDSCHHVFFFFQWSRVSSTAVFWTISEIRNVPTFGLAARCPFKHSKAECTKKDHSNLDIRVFTFPQTAGCQSKLSEWLLVLFPFHFQQKQHKQAKYVQCWQRGV